MLSQTSMNTYTPNTCEQFLKADIPQKKQTLPCLRLSFLTARDGYQAGPTMLSPGHNLIIQEMENCQMLQNAYIQTIGDLQPSSQNTHGQIQDNDWT